MAPLIDWDDPEPNAHLLDWRRRSHDFGLVPVEDGETGTEPSLLVPADRLLEEEEPEALDDQDVAHSADDSLSTEEGESDIDTGLPEHASGDRGLG